MAVTDPRTVKVGVLLDRHPDDLGEWLADARAFEAAGAAALWVDPVTGPGLDPFALLAALAALTSQALLVTDLPAGAPGAALATVARLGRGRLALVAEPDRLGELAELAGGCGAFRRLPGTPPAFELVRPPAAATPPSPAAAEAPGGPGGAGDEGAAAERWVRAPAPEGRAAWRAALEEAAEGGAAGLLVPAGPRLLDILRHPDDPEGRQDLQLAQG